MRNTAIWLLAITLISSVCLKEVFCDTSPIVCYSDLVSEFSADQAKLTPHLSKDPEGYAGVYLFGEEGSRSSILILFMDKNLVVQYRKDRFDETSRRWVQDCRLLEPASLRKNQVISPGWSMEFKQVTIVSRPVIVHSNLVASPYPMATLQGLLVVESPVGIANEFGVRNENGLESLPRSSVALLTESDLDGKSRDELKIMRNEIFARYGLIFSSGGDMDRHFRATDWYLPRNEDVYSMLTPVEEANVAFIRSRELQR